jgi:hypothetical protein
MIPAEDPDTPIDKFLQTAANAALRASLHRDLSQGDMPFHSPHPLSRVLEQFSMTARLLNVNEDSREAICLCATLDSDEIAAVTKAFSEHGYKFTKYESPTQA